MPSQPVQLYQGGGLWAGGGGGGRCGRSGSLIVAVKDKRDVIL